MTTNKLPEVLDVVCGHSGIGDPIIDDGIDGDIKKEWSLMMQLWNKMV